MISTADYAFFRRYLKANSGLALPDDKGYLIEGRLAPVAQRLGLAGVAELARRLAEPACPAEVGRAVVEAMTTNESLFFRDKTPFEAFVDTVLPATVAAKPPGGTIRIWCAAASNGQEPYSLAMLLAENRLELAGRKVEILATDISEEVLKRARGGVYSQFEVQRGLSAKRLLAHFTKSGDYWQVVPQIQSMVTFRQHNLLSSFAPLGRFDAIFCRNVLIYFDAATKADVLARLAVILNPGGFLLLGGAESVVGLTEAFRPAPDGRCLYVRNEERRAA